MMLLGAIEGGGTKFVCAIGDASGQLFAQQRFPTVAPQATVNQAIAFFKQQEVLRGERLAGIGIGMFGPIDLNPASEYYGYVTRTPKAGWSFANVLGPVQSAFPDIPVGFDTDVNVAGLGEHQWGAAQAWQTFVYLTVGTGIGGGGLIGGQLMHGLIHPEMGHILVPRRADDPMDEGACPFHINCLEDRATGPAIHKRWNAPGKSLPPDHPAWDLEAYYLAHAVADYMLVLSPEGLILGGSVLHQRQLFPLIREKVRALINGYMVHPVMDNLDAYIVPPALGDDAGIKGGLALALRELGKD